MSNYEDYNPQTGGNMPPQENPNMNPPQVPQGYEQPQGYAPQQVPPQGYQQPQGYAPQQVPQQGYQQPQGYAPQQVPPQGYQQPQGYAPQQVPAAPPVTPANNGDNKKKIIIIVVAVIAAIALIVGGILLFGGDKDGNSTSSSISDKDKDDDDDKDDDKDIDDDEDEDDAEPGSAYGTVDIECNGDTLHLKTDDVSKLESDNGFYYDSWKDEYSGEEIAEDILPANMSASSDLIINDEAVCTVYVVNNSDEDIIISHAYITAIDFKYAYIDGFGIGDSEDELIETYGSADYSEDGYYVYSNYNDSMFDLHISFYDGVCDGMLLAVHSDDLV